MNGFAMALLLVGSLMTFTPETRAAALAPAAASAPETALAPLPQLGQNTACQNHYCQNNGICVPYPVDNFYTCECQPGFNGPFCQNSNAQERPACRPDAEGRARIHTVMVNTFGPTEGGRIRDGFTACAEANLNNPSGHLQCLRSRFGYAIVQRMVQALETARATWKCEQAAQGPALEKALRDLGIISEMTDVAPSSAARIVYRNNNVLGDNTGKTNTPTQVRYQPLNITWANMLPDHYYTIIMIDPDMPSRSTPVAQKTQVLHWLMVNVPGNGVGGRRLAPYIGSGPPPNTGIHRYSFFVYDEGTYPKDYTGVKPFDLIDIGKRVNWNFVQKGQGWTLRDFERWANFGRPVGGNVYRAQWDPEVDRLWRTFNEFYDGSSNQK